MPVIVPIAPVLALIAPTGGFNLFIYLLNITSSNTWRTSTTWDLGLLIEAFVVVFWTESNGSLKNTHAVTFYLVKDTVVSFS